MAAAPGDAITNHAFELRALLRRTGQSDIYARYIDPALAHEVRPLEAFNGTADDLILFHMSIGEPAVHDFVMQRPERLVLLYHNISPSESFAPYEPAFAALLDRGRNELVALRDRAVGAIADSPFNAEELEAIGYTDVRVAPLIIDPTALHGIEPDPGYTTLLRDHVDGPVLLFVGQLLPHKRPDFLIEAFHLLSTAIRFDARLITVGAPRLPRYASVLEQFARELNLPRCWITGSVTNAQLTAFYRRADAFVTASEHEGFCAPLLEAMSFDLPIVARAFAGIPGTLGNTGLLLPPDAGPALMAEAMDAALCDPSVRIEITNGARERLDALSPDRARAAFLEQLMAFV